MLLCTKHYDIVLISVQYNLEKIRIFPIGWFNVRSGEAHLAGALRQQKFWSYYGYVCASML